MELYTTVVKNALEYMDINTEKYSYLTRKIKSMNLNENVITFFDKEGKLIHKSRFSIIGEIDYLNSVWTWGWALANVDKKFIETSRRVLNYGLDLPASMNDIKMKTELITSRTQITNPIQIEIRVALSVFLSKRTFPFKIDHRLGNPNHDNSQLSEKEVKDKKNKKDNKDHKEDNKDNDYDDERVGKLGRTVYISLEEAPQEQ